MNIKNLHIKSVSIGIDGVLTKVEMYYKKHFYFLPGTTPYTGFIDEGSLQGEIINGCKEGIWNEKYESDLVNDVIEEYGLYKHGCKEDKWISYYSNRQIYQQGKYRQGKRDCCWEFFYKTNFIEAWDLYTRKPKISNSLESKTHYKDGELAVFYEGYFPYGKSKEKVNYVNGINEGPYESYHENGQLKSMSNYVNGIEDGLLIRYDENGEIIEEKNYKNKKLIKL